MKLNSTPFEMIKSGEKSIELRLYDEKRQRIKEGDVMGITEKGIEVVGNDIGDACLELVRCLVTDDSGIVTLYYGEGVTEEDAEAIKEALEDEFFELDIELHYGGQPVYYYIISVE